MTQVLLPALFPLLWWNKKNPSGKGKAQNFLWLWETSAMLPAEKCRSTFRKERKMLLLLHSPFHHGFLNTQIMHTKNGKYQSPQLMSEPAEVGNLSCLCYSLPPLSRWRIWLFSLLGLVPPLSCAWPLNWDYITQITLPFAGKVSNHGCSMHCGGSKTLYNPAHRLRLNSGLFKGRKWICCMSWKKRFPLIQ